MTRWDTQMMITMICALLRLQRLESHGGPCSCHRWTVMLSWGNLPLHFHRTTPKTEKLSAYTPNGTDANRVAVALLSAALYRNLVFGVGLFFFT